MIFNLSDQSSIAHRFIADMRNLHTQQDRAKFRRNMERIGEILAYELSRTLEYTPTLITTPLDTLSVPLPQQRIVLATILRAGLPLQQGLLHYFDQADCAFVSAFRRHNEDHSAFDIQLDYVSTPRLESSVLIVADPMLATGATLILTIEQLIARYGQPTALHIVTAIASRAGLIAVTQQFPQASVWMGALDEVLTPRAYISPGLGDAGDLAFGVKSS
jgi:uracil phosphoribosyltransferase